MTPIPPQARDALKGCPHCGAPAHGYAIEPHTHTLVFNGVKMPDHPGSYVIEGQCACGSGMIGATQEEVTARWNNRQPAGAEVCQECGGTGEVFAHADDCTDDLCALNGDMHSCAGRVEPCSCVQPPAGAEVDDTCTLKFGATRDGIRCSRGVLGCVELHTDTPIGALRAILREVEHHPLHTGCDYSQEELDDLGGDAAAFNFIAQTARKALEGKPVSTTCGFDPWVEAIAPLMPADFKDWHENDPKEWPRVTAQLIQYLRESVALWIDQATHARAEVMEECAALVEKMTYRQRWAKAAANSIPIEPCEMAAVIRLRIDRSAPKEIPV